MDSAHPKAEAEALAEAEWRASVEDQRDAQKLVRQTGNLAMAYQRLL